MASGIFAPTFATHDVTADVRGSDTVAFQKGHITIVPLDGNNTAPSQRR